MAGSTGTKRITVNRARGPDVTFAIGETALAMTMRDLPDREPAVAMAPLLVRTLAPDDCATGERWDAFVARCPAATFFHRAGWQRIIANVFRHRTHYLYAERSDAIVGVLPLAQVKSLLFGNALVSLPFAVYGGVATLDEEAGAVLEAHAQQLARQLGVDHLELRNVAPRHADWPTQDLYVTFRKAILPDVDANLQAIPRKQRAMVRKGIKNELKSAIDPTAERFFALYADNVHRHGTPPYSRHYFEALLREFGPDAEVLTVTDAGGKPLSSVLSFYFRDEVLPYYAGDDVAARDLAANDFKYWELMRRACERGLKVFDYGRSKKDTGPYAFKKNWGFEPQPLHYEYCLYKRDAVPQNNPLNPKYRLMIAAWQRLPIGVANALGPHVVRCLG
jgi:FemAB-related protein (PEP-CTERM system-associated)